ncbi:unnamed protein product [Lampetra planeri]
MHSGICELTRFKRSAQRAKKQDTGTASATARGYSPEKHIEAHRAPPTARVPSHLSHNEQQASSFSPAVRSVWPHHHHHHLFLLPTRSPSLIATFHSSADESRFLVCELQGALGAPFHRRHRRPHPAGKCGRVSLTLLPRP